MTAVIRCGTVTFSLDGHPYRLNIFQHDGETIYEFADKWFHGPDGFLEKARIGGKRVTTVMLDIEDLQVRNCAE